MRQAQGNNLCAYYVCENMHNQVGPRKSLAEWQQEVSRKLVNISTLIVKSYIKYSYFSVGREDAQSTYTRGKDSGGSRSLVRIS